MTIRISAALLLLVFGACQSTEKPEPDEPVDGLEVTDFTLGFKDTSDAEEGDGMIAVGDLPEKYIDLLEAWKHGGFVWEVKRSEALSDPELAAFLVDNLIVLLVDEYRSIQAGIRDRGGAVALAKNVAFERATEELVICGTPAAEALAETLALTGDNFAILAKDVLMKLGTAGAPPVAKLLEREKAAVRFRAADALGRLPGAGEQEADVLARMRSAATADESNLVRVRATTSLGERGLWSQVGRSTGNVDLEPYRLALEQCLVNSSEEVRIAAANALRTLGDRRAIKALIGSATAAGKADQTPELRQHVATLKALAGVDNGWDMIEWERWWNENRATIEASRGF
jgi:hypothetical protein